MSTILSLIQSILQTNGRNSNDWKEICNQINMSPSNCKVFAQEIKKIIKENNPSTLLLILNLVDYAVDECLLPLHSQIASKDFITSMLFLIKLKEHKDIQEKVLCLVKKWGIKFEKQKDILPNFYETYKLLEKNGVVFPIQIKNDYIKYLSNESDFNPFKDDNSNQVQVISHPIKINNYHDNENILIPNYGDMLLPLDNNNYPDEYHSLTKELINILENITVGNQLIDNADIEANVDEIIKELVYYLEMMGKKIKKAIEEDIENEAIMMICLGISEDIEKIFNRYNELRDHLKPTPFVSVFKNDYSQYNMIKEQPHKIPSENINKENIIKQNDSQNINLLSFDIQPVEILPNINELNIDQNQANVININQLNMNMQNDISDINNIFDFTKNK